MGSKTQEGSALAGFKGRLSDDDMRFYLPEEGGGAKTHTQNRLISIKTSIKSIIYRNICSNSCFGFCWRHQACPIS